jgi:hypothetical protein
LIANHPASSAAVAHSAVTSSAAQRPIELPNRDSCGHELPHRHTAIDDRATWQLIFIDNGIQRTAAILILISGISSSLCLRPNSEECQH